MLTRHKELPKYFGILIFAWLVRSSLFGAMAFGLFMAWNLFLATVPLLLGMIIRSVVRKPKSLPHKAALVFLGAAWLLFLPNAFYLLTDFMHLNSDVLVNLRGNEAKSGLAYERGDGLYILDSLLLFASTAYGSFVGGLALIDAHSFLGKRFGQYIRVILISLIVLLSSIGVYIGRYGRWNSWDAFTRPLTVVKDTVENHMSGPYFSRFLLVIFTVSLFQTISFVLVKKLMSKPRVRVGVRG